MGGAQPMVRAWEKVTAKRLGRRSEPMSSWVKQSLLRQCRSWSCCHIATWKDSRGKLERSEEHTSELQSQFHIVCRLLLEKTKTLGPPKIQGPAVPPSSASTICASSLSSLFLEVPPTPKFPLAPPRCFFV